MYVQKYGQENYLLVRCLRMVRCGFLGSVTLLVVTSERQNKTAVDPLSTHFSEKYIGKGKLYILSINSLENTKMTQREQRCSLLEQRGDSLPDNQRQEIAA